MLALLIEYSKLMLLFVLIGTVVTLSRYGGRSQLSSARPRGLAAAKPKRLRFGEAGSGDPAP